MIIKKLKDSYFVKTFRLLKKNPDNLFLIFILDIWFVAALLLSSKLTGLSGKILFRQPLQFYSITPLLIFAVGYYLVIMVIYSFFKYFVLHYLKGMSKKVKMGFKRFGSFFLLNFIVITFLFIIFIALNGIFLLNVKSQLRTATLLLISIPFISFSYAIINIMHTLFINLKKNKEVLIKTIKIAFIGIKSYAGIYLSSIAILIAYYFFYYTISFILKNTASYMIYYSAYLKIFIILTGIILYLIIFFNRAYFYLIIKEKFLKSAGG